MMEWKFKVGDIIKDSDNKYKVVSKQISSNTYLLLNISTQELLRVSKITTELLVEKVEQKSLFEQALELVNLKLYEEFEFDFGGYRGEGVYKIDSDGVIWKKWVSMCMHGWENSNYNLLDIILSNKKTVAHIAKNRKSEAELILEELKVVVDKANDILRKSGY